MPSALLLILGEDIPGLVAVTPASAAAAKSAHALGKSQGAFVISGRTRTTRSGLSSYRGGGFSSATGINYDHQIAEASDTGSGYSHAVMWSNGTITDLVTVGGIQSAPNAINDNGQRLAGRTSPGSPSATPPAGCVGRDCSNRLAERTDTGGEPP